MQKLLPFEDFLTYLQQQGFALGVDDFLQIQTLLNRLPKDCPPEKLKSLMCPLLASNEEEQEYFYRAFDRYFTKVVLKHEKLPSRDIEKAKRNFQKEQKEAQIGEAEDWSETTHRQKYGDKMVFTFWGFVMNHLKWIVAVVLILIASLFWGISQTYNTSQPNTPQTATKQSQTHEKPQTSIPPAPITNPPNETTPNSKPNPTTPKTANKKPSNELENSPQKVLFDYWCLLWGILLVVCGFVLYRTFRKAEDDFYLELNNKLKPPHYWNIEVPKTELKMYRSSIFKQVSQQLKQRQKTPTSKIDIPKTLTATIEAAGYPRFEYLEKSELPEYLMLLPQGQGSSKVKTKDQKLQLFDAWYEALKEQEVFVHRFFYSVHKPEWCFDEVGNLFHIKELYAQFGHCRLLAFVGLREFPVFTQHPPNPLQRGNSRQNSPFEEFIPIAREGGWDVSVFDDWQEKVLLNTSPTSKAVQNWAAKNNLLLMPANLESMTELNRVLEGEVTASTFHSTQKMERTWEGLSVAETVRELKERLNKVSFKWLCATAMYPEMNWDLTVYIGEALFDERELAKEENVMPLVNLPWFRKGKMPDELRMALAANLDEHSQFLVKDALLHLLKLNPLVDEEYSKDFYDYQLHIALEEAQLRPEDKYKLSTLKHLTEQEQFAESRYQQVVLRYLARRENLAEGKSLGFGLGETLKKKFNREDIEVKEIAISHKSEKVTYVYPKAPLTERAQSLFVDLMFCGFASPLMVLFGSVFYFMYLVEIESSFVLAAGFVPLFYLSLDSWSKGSGLGKYGVFRVIDIHTNLPCSLWQSMIRRSFPFLMLLLFKIVERYIGIEVAGFVGMAICFQYLLVFVSNEQGRKMMDYLAGTQVVRESDYQNGSFEVERSNEIKDEVEFIEWVRPQNYIYPLPSAFRRFAAFIVDLFSASFAVFLINSFLLMYFGYALNIYIATICLFFLIDVLMQEYSFGKGPLELIVVDVESGQNCSVSQAFIRRVPDVVILLLLVVMLESSTLARWLILLVGVGLVPNFSTVFWGDGRKWGDYMAGTQVVDVDNYNEKAYKKEDEIKKISANHTYTYPIANNDNRIKANLADGIYIIIFSVFMLVLFSMIFGTMSESLNPGFLFYIFLASSFVITIDNFGESGMGKADNLMIIDLKTNQRSEWWKVSLRRVLDFLSLFACWSFAYFLGLTYVYYLLILVVFLFVNFILALKNKGRRLGDYLLGTQVINQSDFEAKNYKIE